MKTYFKYFRVPFIIIGILAAVYVSLLVIKNVNKPDGYRTNYATVGTQRVFDYADVLTQEEEIKLQALIEKRQEEIKCDIVILTINEEYDRYPDSFNDSYAREFYIEAAFGYDKPVGDGVIYLDNYNRSYDGWAYSWMLTKGKCTDEYTDSQREHAIEVACDGVNSDPYKAYSNFVNCVAKDMSVMIGIEIPAIIIIIAALIVALIFFFAKKANPKGKKTTIASTYVEGGKPVINVQQDMLYDKKLTSRTIQTSSSGGGRSGGGGGGFKGGGGRH